MIRLEGIQKVFIQGSQEVRALEDVSLTIEKGDIFGIIGYSGAGKSTLLRCINGLEKPTAGKVFIGNQEISQWCEKELMSVRKEIGMIFQHFNLMQSKNVFENVAFPLKYIKLSKAEKEKRVKELLALVDLEDKAAAYPSQLSGGQKQRVAIARALATNPKILLCDEATSALDPQTTRSILALLKDIREKLGITIVLITHQMEVIKEVCTKVAVMEKGKVLEAGSLVEVFGRPKSHITKEFVEKDLHYERFSQPQAGHIAKLLHLRYIGENSGKPLISDISRRFDVEANITVGNIEKLQNTWVGNLVIDLQGTREAVEAAIAYLDEQKIEMEVIDDERITCTNYA